MKKQKRPKDYGRQYRCLTLVVMTLLLCGNKVIAQDVSISQTSYEAFLNGQAVLAKDPKKLSKREYRRFLERVNPYRRILDWETVARFTLDLNYDYFDAYSFLGLAAVGLGQLEAAKRYDELARERFKHQKCLLSKNECANYEKTFSNNERVMREVLAQDSRNQVMYVVEYNYRTSRYFVCDEYSMQQVRAQQERLRENIRASVAAAVTGAVAGATSFSENRGHWAAYGAAAGLQQQALVNLYTDIRFPPAFSNESPQQRFSDCMTANGLQLVGNRWVFTEQEKSRVFGPETSIAILRNADTDKCELIFQFTNSHDDLVDPIFRLTLFDGEQNSLLEHSLNLPAIFMGKTHSLTLSDLGELCHDIASAYVNDAIDEKSSRTLDMVSGQIVEVVDQ